jgi:hypothetical protein
MMKKKIATMLEIREKFPVSPSTVWRALLKEGYVTSCNKKSSFYALKSSLNFDKNGIFKKKGIFFCQEGFLRKQILKYINESDAGSPSKEIINIYGSSSRHVLCQLNVKGKVQSKSLNATRYYFSNDDVIRENQIVERVKIIEIEQQENEKIKHEVILSVMGELLKDTTISPTGIQNKLRKMGISVSIKNVVEIFNIYELRNIKKKL